MRTLTSLLIASSLIACYGPETVITDGSTTCTNKDGGAPPDLLPPPAKCAAAKGLAGDNLLCVDFTSPQVITNLTTMGWDFTSQCAPGWAVVNGKLQVSNSFTSSCTFIVPPLNSNDYQKYNSFTLSIAQTVALPMGKQTANIYLSSPNPSQQIWYQSISLPRMVTMLKIDKADLPNGGNKIYQPLFQITTNSAGAGYDGWQIESISINGNI